MDENYNPELAASSENFNKKNELEKSIKLANNEITKYKLMLEKSQKEDEEVDMLKQSLENDKFRHYHLGGFEDKEFTERDYKREHHDTLEYSPTSRKDSEMKNVETEFGETFRSFDESFKKIDNIIKNSPRVDKIQDNYHASPMSSRRGSNSKSQRRSESPASQNRKRSESPATHNKHLGSPAENK